MRDSEGEEEAKKGRRGLSFVGRPPPAWFGHRRPGSRTQVVGGEIWAVGLGWPTGTNRPRGTDPPCAAGSVGLGRPTWRVLMCGVLARQVPAAVRRRLRRPFVCCVLGGWAHRVVLVCDSARHQTVMQRFSMIDRERRAHGWTYQEDQRTVELKNGWKRSSF